VKVLIATEDSVLADDLEKNLSDWGFEVFYVNDGLKALQMLQSSDDAPSIGIIDEQISVMSAHDILLRLRDRAAAHYQYLLILSSSSDVTNCLIGLDAGADVILQKPVTMVQFRIQLQVARRIMEHQMRQRVLQEDLWNQANQDALTNIPNRRAILRSLERNAAACAQREQPLGVVMIDLDYFKQINDTFGHDGGDCVLREVAERMKAGLRNTDTIGRFGGEEFLAVIPNCAGEELLRIAERIRSSVNRPVQTENQLIPVSCSIGLAVRWDMNDGTIHDALQRSDKALYVAKEMGRNRVVSAWTLNNRSQKIV
jgi:diguanylate cyclase (GGDEF)-like protein